MTRINVAPVEIIKNEHLLAEYVEIPRPFLKVIKRIEKGQTAIDIKYPERYVLGSGHETFFFNKCKFLINRYLEICEELTSRGYNLDKAVIDEVIGRYGKIEGSSFDNDWEPTHEDIYLNFARMCKRSKFKLVLQELDISIDA